MSTYGAGSATNNNSPLYNASLPVEPRRMELSLNADDGSLQTAPLSQVLLAATDALYTDLHNMSEGDLDVITTTNPLPQGDDAAGADDDDAPEPSAVLRKKERMSNLSFAQRRHELAWRLASNGKSLQHVVALTAAAACTDLGHAVQVSTSALQHTRTAWVQADEAQDALFFFHAQLFPARAAPHDIYGASDLLLRGHWYDLPRDLLLHTDRYESSEENACSKSETDQRWQLTVRDKLIRGEVGWLRRNQMIPPQHGAIREALPLWKVSLKGGIVKFTVGQPKVTTSEGSSVPTMQYPIEALLTALPSKHLAWTLLSVNVNVRAKTGEFNHQLETSNRQRYDLHRLAATAMVREEARSNQEHATAELSKLGSSALQNMDMVVSTGEASVEEESPPPSRPLNALFQITHTFLMAWTLEVLSAQAQALRRGVWAAADSDSLKVAPVSFVENGEGFMSISFWKVDDSYGPPSMGALTLENTEEQTAPSKLEVKGNDEAGATGELSSRLTLLIRAESKTGIKVWLSGGGNIMKAPEYQRKINQSTIRHLLDAASNPFALSASDALLAATKLCAEFKCRAVVEALQSISRNRKTLPSWIQLRYERGCIAVGARIRYHGVPHETSSGIPILFHISCDARTGSFVVAFPRSMQLLRRLACNDIQASEQMALRIASVPPNRRKAVASNSTGRIVREAFDSLIRSINLVGQRAGVGGSWDDIDEKSSSLRERSIVTACGDVKSALIKCSGLAALYGIVPVTIRAAVGLEANSDIAGPAIDSINEGTKLLNSPPVSIVLGQELIETSIVKPNAVTAKTSHIEQSLFSLSCRVSDSDGIILYPFAIGVKLDSPNALPERTFCSLEKFETETDNGVGAHSRPSKKLKLAMNGHLGNETDSETLVDFMDEVSRLVEVFAAKLESKA